MGVWLGLENPVGLPPHAGLVKAQKALCSHKACRDLLPHKSSSSPGPTWSADTLSQQVVDLESLRHSKRCSGATKHESLQEHYLNYLWQSKLMRRGMLVGSRRHCPQWCLCLVLVGDGGVALWPITFWHGPVDPSSLARRRSLLLGGIVLPDFGDDLVPLVAGPPVLPALRSLSSSRSSTAASAWMCSLRSCQTSRSGVRCPRRRSAAGRGAASATASCTTLGSRFRVCRCPWSSQLRGETPITCRRRS